MPLDLNRLPAGAGGVLQRGAQRYQASPMGMASRSINEAGEAGFFSPFGSPRLRALRRRRALQLSDAQRRRSSNYGRLAGLDPMATRQAMVDADISANAGTAGALNEAEFQEGQGNLDFQRSLFTGELDFMRNRALERERAKAASRGGIGQAIGSVAGAFIPGAGALFGGGGGGGGGGGRSPYNYGDTWMADGGLVTRPTRALIGEGGEPEAVVPRSHPGFGVMQRFGVLPQRMPQGQPGFGLAQRFGGLLQRRMPPRSSGFGMAAGLGRGYRG